MSRLPLEAILEDRGSNPTGTVLKSPDKDVIEKRPRTRARSSSRVSVDYFDPTGMQQLRTTMSRISRAPESEAGVNEKPDLPFDFEAHLRSIFQQCVTCPVFCDCTTNISVFKAGGFQHQEPGVGRHVQGPTGDWGWSNSLISTDVWLHVQPHGHAGKNPKC